MQEKLPPIAQRNARVQTAVALGQPDRVPFVPSVGNFYALGYGLTVQQAMTELTSVIPPMEKFLAQYDPDLLFAPTFFSIPLMEQADVKNLRWPGDRWNLPPDTPYQYLDETYLEDDEWDDFLKDPSQFLMQKVLARRYGALAGLEHFNAYALCGQTPIYLMAAGMPGLREALQNLLELADTAGKAVGEMAQVAMRGIELGYPVWGDLVVMTPFDEFAGCVRGLMPTLMDLHADPELVGEAVARWGEYTLPASIGKAKMMHAQYVMMPLHCGIDEFMSPENYDRYYWPQLKQTMEAFIANDITPIVLCEGNYNTRLETLTDITPGKVIYMFEKVDMKRAKDVLGKVACIAGNLDTSSLICGTREQVIDETKRLIDTCAPGGGYIMSNSQSLDNARHDLLEAWHETTVTYGKY